MVVSDNYLKAPWADYLYACDFKWWKYHYRDYGHHQMPKPFGIFGFFAGELWTQHKNLFSAPGINHVVMRSGEGLGKDNEINGGGNSGYQAINLAYLFGAREIILLGFDMKRGPSGEKHWFGDHPCGMNSSSPYDRWLKNFNCLAIDLTREGVRVINCTADSALTCFDRMTLEQLFLGDKCSSVA
jgi:hypothetical protein